jgi:uncharacterized protein
MNPLDQGPLTQYELEELDQFLLNAEGIDDAMDVAMLDGFLTAIVCGPNMVTPSEWICWVCDSGSGEEPPNLSREPGPGALS